MLIGHAGHPEVVGTLGQLPDGAITLVQTVEEAEVFQPRDASKLAYVTQTTLSLDDTAGIVAVLKRRFPNIVAPHKEDICYATTNRQEAVKRVAPQVDALVVVGAPNSSNSRRLQEVAERAGCRYSVLVQRAAEIDWSRFDDIKTLGVTAGASAPEVLVEEILDAFAARYTLDVQTVSGADESGMFFPLPRQLRDTRRRNSFGSSDATFRLRRSRGRTIRDDQQALRCLAHGAAWLRCRHPPGGPRASRRSRRAL